MIIISKIQRSSHLPQHPILNIHLQAHSIWANVKIIL